MKISLEIIWPTTVLGIRLSRGINISFTLEDKTHFIFSLKNVNTPGSAAKQFFPRKAVESFVVFYKSNYVFCVPYAFAIGP